MYNLIFLSYLLKLYCLNKLACVIIYKCRGVMFIADSKERETNDKKVSIGDIILFILGISIIIFIVTSIISIYSNKHGKSYVNTKWKTTDGYELIIKEDTCFLTKDGKETDKFCLFTSNANNTGVGKLEICNRSGGCVSEDLTRKAPNRWYFNGYEFYKQK